MLPIASDLRLLMLDNEGPDPVARLDFFDKDGNLMGCFHFNLTSAETLHLTLARWVYSHLPSQTAPTTPTMQ